MKLTNFYLAAFLPVLTIVTLVILGFIESVVFFIFAYYIYRCILDYHKLKAQGVVGKKDAWRFIFSGHTITYFKELYFKQ